MDNIFTYTRAEAIADGVQFECPLAKEAGYQYPVFITCGIHSLINEAVKYGVNDYNGVLWDILNVLKVEIRKQPNVKNVRAKVVIIWINDKPKVFEVVASIGAMDFDDAAPALTIMLPNED